MVTYGINPALLLVLVKVVAYHTSGLYTLLGRIDYDDCDRIQLLLRVRLARKFLIPALGAYS